jgi:CRP-like cAMP-binding protein
LFKKGDMGASFFIIDEGALEVTATTDTGQAVFALKRAGDIILEVINIICFVLNH